MAAAAVAAAAASQMPNAEVRAVVHVGAQPDAVEPPPPVAMAVSGAADDEAAAAGSSAAAPSTSDGRKRTWDSHAARMRGSLEADKGTVREVALGEVPKLSVTCVRWLEKLAPLLKVAPRHAMSTTRLKRQADDVRADCAAAWPPGKKTITVVM